MQCFTSSGPDGLLGIAHVQLLANKHLAFVVPSLSTGDMSIPVQGRVTSQNNQAILMLSVPNNAPSPERPTSDLLLLEKAMRQDRKCLFMRAARRCAASIWQPWCAISRRDWSWSLYSVWDWDPMAEAKLLEFLAKLKKIVAPKPITLSLPAPAPAAASFCT